MLKGLTIGFSVLKQKKEMNINQSYVYDLSEIQDVFNSQIQLDRKFFTISFVLCADRIGPDGLMLHTNVQVILQNPGMFS